MAETRVETVQEGDKKALKTVQKPLSIIELYPNDKDPDSMTVKLTFRYIVKKSDLLEAATLAKGFLAEIGGNRNGR